MPNDINNRLEIRCDSLSDMKKIKSMLFKETRKKKEPFFTMDKLLPIPMITYDKNIGNRFQYYESSTWGTRCNVYNIGIEENSENSVLIYYCTLNSPNVLWVKALCKRIEWQITSKSFLFTPEIYLEHRYFCYYNEWNGKLEWQPGLKTDYIFYDFYEYCEIYDPEMYKLFSDLKENSFNEILT